MIGLSMCNLRTDHLIAYLMRKVVTPFVFLSLFVAFWSCESQPYLKNKPSEKHRKLTKLKKHDKSSQDVEVQDTLHVNNEITGEEQSAEDTLFIANSESDSSITALRDTSLIAEKIDSVRQDQNPDTLLEPEVDPDAEIGDSPQDETYSEQGHFPNNGLNLEKERLVKTELLEVYRPDYSNIYDSTLSVVEKRISLHPDEVSKKMVVERWISPVNYRGYKFNRKKLMLYGVGKEYTINIFYYLDAYYFSLRNQIYSLKEANSNTPLTLVSDSLLEKHLLEYEDQL